MEGTTPTSATGSTTTGPTSFSEMPSSAWSDAPSASAPSSESTQTDPSAATTTPPVETAPGEGQPQQGEPPKERWNDILANARTKAAQEANAQFEQQYGWAKQIPQAEFQQVQQLARTLSADPIQGLQQLIAEVRKNPQYDAQLKSLAARALSQRSAPQIPAEPQMVNVQLEDGSVVPMPRDPAAWLAHHEQRWLSQIEQKFQPVTRTIENLQQREAAAERAQQIQAFTDTTFNDAVTWQGMDSKDNQIAVAQRMAQMGIPDDASPEAVKLALHTAWRQVVVPKLAQSTEAKLLDSLKTKAAASSSVNPGSAAPSASRQVTRFQDLGPDSWR
jgi:hypothetical protein